MIRLKVREIAEAQGLNASQLARKADMSYPPVYKIWNDPYTPVTTTTLMRLAKALGVPATDLIEDESTDSHWMGGLRFTATKPAA